MNVKINLIKHNDQRYPTIGDWYWHPDGTLVIKVSDLKNWKFEMLVAVHELVEALLCRDRGVNEEEVTEFDKLHLEYDEPGDLPEAPYHREHMMATYFETRLAAQLGVNWDEYAKAILDVSKDVSFDPSSFNDAT